MPPEIMDENDEYLPGIYNCCKSGYKKLEAKERPEYIHMGKSSRAN